VRIAVLGAHGQLGRDLLTRLPGEPIALTRADMDLARPDTIGPGLATARAEVFVNCAAYNFVDKAETEPAEAFAVNAIGVRHLAHACREAKVRFVQISTDFVFGQDQTRQSPLTESTVPGPVSVYGVSKLAGEQFALAAHPANLVVRTCGLYGVWGSGGKGGNFVETMLRLAGQGKPFRVVSDQRCTPSFTADIAEAIAGLIRVNAVGIVHATNDGDCTWFEFASEIFRQSGLTPDLTAITSEQFNAPARRPNYSVLSTDRLVSLGLPRPRPWREALAAYLSERKTRSA
jgi:dTDP-4-dehydrorhamnose reductase